ncbi:MAG: hypothetical protein HUU31_19260, partial [Anaerolineae bacterium]|nr:hypothetical protein [Anaerolineae bacterium]
VSPLLIVGAGVLLGRAALGLSARRKPVAAKVIGFREIAYGVLYAVLVGIAI